LYLASVFQLLSKIGHFYASVFSSIINNKSVKKICLDILLEEKLYIISLAQME